MDSMSKGWWPRSPMTNAQRAVLTVPYSSPSPMTPNLLRSLLEHKFARMLADNPSQARQAMEMSQENAPELYALAQSSPPSQWPALLVRSEGMERLLALIDWHKETAKTGHPVPKPAPISLAETLELLA